jgi:hypothetical protein
MAPSKTRARRTTSHSRIERRTRLLEEGARSQNKEIDFVWQDVYHWIDESYNEKKWNKNLKIILKNFYYFQNEN